MEGASAGGRWGTVKGGWVWMYVHVHMWVLLFKHAGVRCVWKASTPRGGSATRDLRSHAALQHLAADCRAAANKWARSPELLQTHRERGYHSGPRPKASSPFLRLQQTALPLQPFSCDRLGQNDSAWQGLVQKQGMRRKSFSYNYYPYLWPFPRVVSVLYNPGFLSFDKQNSKKPAPANC